MLLTLDSSAPVTLYEPVCGSIQVRAALAAVEICTTSSLARVEVLGALARACRGGPRRETRPTRQ